MQVNFNKVHPEGASQLVLGKWPSLEKLAVSFSCLHEQLFKTLIQGDWPILKELHVSTNAVSHWDPVHDWSKEQVQAWQAVEDKCRSMCMSMWPDLQVLRLPSIPASSANLECEQN